MNQRRLNELSGGDEVMNDSIDLDAIDDCPHCGGYAEEYDAFDLNCCRTDAHYALDSEPEPVVLIDHAPHCIFFNPSLARDGRIESHVLGVWLNYCKDKPRAEPKIIHYGERPS